MRYSREQFWEALETLGFTPKELDGSKFDAKGASRAVSRRQKELMKDAYPDLPGGDLVRAQKINVARDVLFAWIKEGRPPIEKPRAGDEEDIARRQAEEARQRQYDEWAARAARENRRTYRPPPPPPPPPPPTAGERLWAGLALLFRTALRRDNRPVTWLARVAAICLLAGPVYIAATADFSQPGIDTGMPTGPRLGDDLPDDAPEAAPKIYKKALRTYYDYAAPAAAGYVPPVPAFTLGDVPLEVRVLQQRAVGALRQFEITWANRYQFARFMDRLERSSPEFRAIDRDIGQVMGEKALLLICWYVHPQRDQVTLRRHWFRAYPAHVARNDLNRRARTIRHPLLEVSAPRASCPSQA